MVAARLLREEGRQVDVLAVGELPADLQADPPVGPGDQNNFFHRFLREINSSVSGDSGAPTIASSHAGSGLRPAIVSGSMRPIRSAPQADAPLLWQAEPGVIGRISKCDGDYCRIQIDEKIGFIEQAGLWGLDPNERLP